MQPRIWVQAARALLRAPGRSRRHAMRQDGFSLIEAMVGLTVVFGAMMLILTGVNTGVRGVLTGRQRQSATAVAKETIEDIRRACYERIGHAFADPNPANNDATLDTDPNLTASGTGTSRTYTYAPTSEKLARATTGSDCTGPAVVPAHAWDGTSDGTPYRVVAYVTHVEPTAAGGGVRHKRITVDVTWDNPAYGTAAAGNTLRLSSLVFDPDEIGGTSGGGGGTSTYPIITATAAPSAGTATFSGTLVPAGGGAGSSIVAMAVNLPDADATLHSFLIDDISGTASTHAFTVTDATAAAPPGCTKSGSTISCPAASSSATADSDGGTSPTPPFYDDDFASVVSQNISTANGMYSVTTGSGTADSKATACDTATCNTPFGDGDGYAADLHIGTGPTGMGMPFTVGGGISGNLFSIGAGTNARGEIDRDYAGTLPRTIAKSKNTYGAVDIFRLQSTALGGFGSTISVVSVSGFDVTTTADIGNAGTSAAGASCSASGTVTVNVIGPLGVTPVNLTPCTTVKDETYGATFVVIDALGLPVATVTSTVRIQSNAYTEVETPDGAGFKYAESKLLDWLIITANVEIKIGGATVVDMDAVVDYGDLVAVAERAP